MANAPYWLSNVDTYTDEEIKKSTFYLKLIPICEHHKIMDAIKYYSIHQSPTLMSQYLTIDLTTSPSYTTELPLI